MNDYSKVPAHMQEALERYVEHHIRPGSFLTAILENDFIRAFAQADTTNRNYLAQWAETLYWELPSACWGSKEKVESWLDKREA